MDLMWRKTVKQWNSQCNFLEQISGAKYLISACYINFKYEYYFTGYDKKYSSNLKVSQT